MATVSIKHRVTGVEICTGETLRAAVLANLADLRGADLRGADLRGAYLRGAYLRGAYLRGADLGDAYLRDAYLRDAYLRGAYLRGAYLRDADLRDADLRGAYLGDAYLGGADLGGENGNRAKICWQSHDLIAEILRRAAGDDIAKLKVAGYVLICRDKCWAGFLGMGDPLTGWACGVLREWVTDIEELPPPARPMLTNGESDGGT